MNKILYLLLFVVSFLISCGPAVDPEFIGAEKIEITKADNDELSMRTRLIFESLDGGKAFVKSIKVTPYINGKELSTYESVAWRKFSRHPKRHRQAIFMRVFNESELSSSDQVTKSLFKDGVVGKTVNVKLTGIAELEIAGKLFSVPIEVNRRIKIEKPEPYLKLDGEYNNEDLFQGY